MILLKRALLLGVLSWVVPFAVSFLVFPLKQVNAPLFDTAMALVVVLTSGALLPVYFRGRAVNTGETVAVALVWLVINLVLDYPMFAYGPMEMTAARYYSEIGVDYLVFPAFALGAARLARNPRQEATKS